MRSLIPGSRRARRGSSALEFALSSPVLLLLFAGVVELGQYLHASDALVSAVSQGARYGATANPARNQSGSTMAQSVAEGSYQLTGLGYQVNFNSQVLGVAPDRIVQVTGSLQYQGLISYLQLPSQILYTHQVDMIYQ